MTDSAIAERLRAVEAEQRRQADEALEELVNDLDAGRDVTDARIVDVLVRSGRTAEQLEERLAARRAVREDRAALVSIVNLERIRIAAHKEVEKSEEQIRDAEEQLRKAEEMVEAKRARLRSASNALEKARTAGERYASAHPEDMLVSIFRERQAAQLKLDRVRMTIRQLEPQVAEGPPPARLSRPVPKRQPGESPTQREDRRKAAALKAEDERKAREHRQVTKDAKAAQKQLPALEKELADATQRFVDAAKAGGKD